MKQRKRGRPNKKSKQEFNINSLIIANQNYASKKIAQKQTIPIPSFQNICIDTMQESDSSAEDTSDEYYQSIHYSKEKIERFLREKQDFKKAKAHGISTQGVHKQENSTDLNEEKNLKSLEKFLGNELVSEWYLPRKICKVCIHL